MANGARLSRLSAALDVDHDVETRFVVDELQRLPHDHSSRLTREKLIDRLFVDDELPRALADEHACHRTLAPAGAVIIVANHVPP